MGFAKASELCLTGRAVPAGELEGSGLVNAVVPADELAARAGTIAAEIAANPDPQLRMIKQLLTANGADTDLAAVSKREMSSLRQCYESPEHAEAIRAFAEKRTPKFR
ncbi:MAG: enoyl-CoA hydratase-related protein, partial [Myxococcota bacterium]